ncbi:MAG: cytochrome c oxidase assembly protein, partial [Sciscionella sp.]
MTTDVQSSLAARGRAALTPLLILCVVLAALLAAGLTALSGNTSYLDLGLPSPGALTNYGLPMVRVATEAAAVVCIGSLLFAAFCTPPQRSGVLAADGYAALRTAGWAATAWCVGAVLMTPFTISDSVGQPLSEVLRPDNFFGLFDSLEQAKAWLITAGIVLVLAIACRVALRWSFTAVLFCFSLLGLFPEAVTGHSSAGGAHDLATNSLLYHLLAAAVWIGGLVALLAHARRGGAHLPLAARRFSSVALVCWIVMAVSGVLNALVRLPVHDLFRTLYGALVIVKILALMALGVFGYFQRRRGVRALDAGGSGRALIKLAAMEMLVMFITIGVAAALSHTPPPTDGVARPSTLEVVIGYDLPGPPTVARMLFNWRFDLVYGTAAIVLAALYLLGVRRLRGRGDAWPVGRTAAWLAGCAVLLIATSSGVGRYAPAMFSVHMASHMLLNMLAPVLLVLGGPVTLALRALRPAGKGNPPGPREWLLAAVHSPMARFLTHPVIELLLFVVSYYVLYLSG